MVAVEPWSRNAGRDSDVPGVGCTLGFKGGPLTLALRPTGCPRISGGPGGSGSQGLGSLLRIPGLIFWA